MVKGWGCKSQDLLVRGGGGGGGVVSFVPEDELGLREPSLRIKRSFRI